MKHLIQTLLLLLVLAGCHHKRTPVTALPAPPPAPVAITTPAAPETAGLPPAPPSLQPNAPATPVLNPLGEAEQAFVAGNYAEAARGYDKYLQVQPAGERRPEALFREAVSLASLPNADWNRINGLLKEVVDHYHESPFWAPANVIYTMSGDARTRDQKIKQLTTELEKLKQIDAERRKRP
jgi:hypothetical protein